MNYYEMVKKTSPDQILWIDEKNMYYYGDILKQAEDLAAGLNTDEKEVIGIYSNSPLFQLTAFLACGKREKIPVILHPGLTETELEKIMKVNQIRFLLSENGLRKKCERKPKIKSNWCVAVLTSGSNGTPKLLYRTYQSWAGFFETQNSVFQIDSDTRLFFQGSLSFTGNLNTVLSVLYESASVVTYGGYHPRKWLSLIHRHSVNSIYLVPVKLRSLCIESGEPIGNIRSVFTGSQHLRKNWINLIVEIFINAEKIMYYGAGELSYVTYVHMEELKDKPLSVGKPFRGVKVWIRDGEIYVNSGFLAENLTNPATVHDRGTIDLNGDLLYYGRGEDFINKGGVQINLVSLENKINSIKGVDSALIAATESDSKGNDFILFVILKDGFSAEYLREKIAKDFMSFEVPQKIIEVKEFIWNDSAKADKNEMLRRYDKGT